MPIQVTCQKCHKRFSVSEKFAGKTGPCPNCKATIKVPDKSDEVVIHAPESFGPTDSSGKAVLKPIEREEVKTTPVAIVLIVGSIITSIIVALLLRAIYPDGSAPWALLAVGSLLLAPPLALAGYWFLRNENLEPHRGGSLAIRVMICAVLYAALWGGYALAKHFLFGGNQPQMFHFALIGPALLGAGGAIGLATLDPRVRKCGYPLRILCTGDRPLLLPDWSTGILVPDGCTDLWSSGRVQE